MTVKAAQMGWDGRTQTQQAGPHGAVVLSCHSSGFACMFQTPPELAKWRSCATLGLDPSLGRLLGLLYFRPPAKAETRFESSTYCKGPSSPGNQQNRVPRELGWW
jgi:hypothetical protein